MSLSEKKKKIGALRENIATVNSDLRDVQSELEYLNNRKLVLEKKKKQLESEVVHLEQACRLPDVNFKCSDFKWSQQLHELKSSKFGIQSFRPYQEEVINATMSNRDVILVMPTGGGKSLCFQLPALLSNGFPLVVSPLVSLMEDQAMTLHSYDIVATLLSASTPRDHLQSVYRDMTNSDARLKLLYVTPEKIAKSKRFMAQLQKAYDKGRLSRIAIDEVHCCSQWGHDFRPDYKVLGILKRQFPHSPIIGLTATASTSVLNDVKSILNIAGCDVFRSSYNRANLFYEVRLKPPGKDFMTTLVEMLKGEFANQSGIIYCFSRKDTENVAEELSSEGIVAAPYHASIEPQDRSLVHRNWRNGHIQVVVATTAFGMGIDKPDVRFVIHHSLSKSMENYYQESGRAGRDDKPANCILFFGFVDVFRQSTMVVMEQTGLTKLYQMVAYCTLRGRCRRASLAEHFDESWERGGVECNKMCDACKTKSTASNMDVTTILKTLFKILKESDSKDQRLTGLKLTDLAGKAKKQTDRRKLSKVDYQHIILHLLLEGYLKEDFHFTPYSTISYICPGPRADHIQSDLAAKVTIPMTTGTPGGKVCQKRDLEKPSTSRDNVGTSIGRDQSHRKIKGRSKSDNVTINVQPVRENTKSQTRPDRVNEIIILDNDEEDDEVCPVIKRRRCGTLPDEVGYQVGTPETANQKKTCGTLAGEIGYQVGMPETAKKKKRHGTLAGDIGTPEATKKKKRKTSKLSKGIHKSKIIERETDISTDLTEISRQSKVKGSVHGLHTESGGCQSGDGSLDDKSDCLMLDHNHAELDVSNMSKHTPTKMPNGNLKQEMVRSKVRKKVSKEITDLDVIGLFEHDAHTLQNQQSK